jgi:hypothetical protein
LCETANALKKKDTQAVFATEPVKEKALIIKDGRDGWISQYAYLGSVSPDLGFFSDTTGFAGYLIHNNRSGSLGVKLVEHAHALSAEKDEDKKVRNGLMALALGYISHVAADMVVHPYVNILAGATHNMGLPDVKPTTGSLSMHEVLEGHQDSWIIRNYFDSKLEIGNWNHFVSALPGKGIGGQRSKTPKETKKVLGGFCKCFKDVYGRQLDVDKLAENALGRFNTALLKGYGSSTQSLRIPINPSQNLVDYRARITEEEVEVEEKGKKKKKTKKKKKKIYKPQEDKTIVENDYKWYLLGKAVEASKTLCGDALDLFYDRNSERLPKYLKDWNLDTGYRIKVDKKDDGIHIRYEHSWAHKYGLYDHS